MNDLTTSRVAHATSARAAGLSPNALPFIDPADMPDRYAITGKGKGNCMQPLYGDGALLVGDKRQEPQPGEAVLIHFHRHIAPRYGMPGWIKRLVHIWPEPGEDDLITVEQLNPPRRYVIPASHVAAMHKCVGTAESMGNGRAAWNPSKAREG